LTRGLKYYNRYRREKCFGSTPISLLIKRPKNQRKVRWEKGSQRKKPQRGGKDKMQPNRSLIIWRGERRGTPGQMRKKKKRD